MLTPSQKQSKAGRINTVREQLNALNKEYSRLEKFRLAFDRLDGNKLRWFRKDNYIIVDDALAKYSNGQYSVTHLDLSTRELLHQTLVKLKDADTKLQEISQQIQALHQHLDRLATDHYVNIQTDR